MCKRKKCLQKRVKSLIKELKVLKKKMVFKTPGKKYPKVKNLQKMVILLEQVATENILKIAILKNLVPCSVSEILTKY